jgi:hypothetical protein
MVRELPDGALQIVDGHVRAETTLDSVVPVLVVDLDDNEAEKVLATFDPLAAMATSRPRRQGRPTGQPTQKTPVSGRLGRSRGDRRV